MDLPFWQWCVCLKVRSTLGQSCKRHGLCDVNLWSGKIHLEATSGMKWEHFVVVNSIYDLWQKHLQPEEYLTGLPARKCMWVPVSGCHFCWEICSYGGCKWPWCKWTWQIYGRKPHYMGNAISVSQYKAVIQVIHWNTYWVHFYYTKTIKNNIKS